MEPVKVPCLMFNADMSGFYGGYLAMTCEHVERVFIAQNFAEVFERLKEAHIYVMTISEDEMRKILSAAKAVEGEFDPKKFGRHDYVLIKLGENRWLLINVGR